ncbi:hypothetical protein DQ04_17991000 [Trypanosoma grayi]|uniref:hypothetical protein n=1 Tax=Trypanosoma grayi TaxID=71804 RepID=UPI0004F43F39|nr:hypothetical protein DQ04_17991000 [Trypanosoma grayi]KEG05841.1 hypothetical protein DQ04_17991000 [Trypanosoma grayi]
MKTIPSPDGMAVNSLKRGTLADVAVAFLETQSLSPYPGRVKKKHVERLKFHRRTVLYLFLQSWGKQQNEADNIVDVELVQKWAALPLKAPGTEGKATKIISKGITLRRRGVLLMLHRMKKRTFGIVILWRGDVFSQTE